MFFSSESAFGSKKVCSQSVYVKTVNDKVVKYLLAYSSVQK